jgi:signal transduction histidine kinase
VVAYSFATINVHAGVAAHVADRRPDQAAKALEAIKAISGEASREFREILGLMPVPREGEGVGPAVARLDGLAATMTAAGLTTRVVVSGSPRRVPAAVDRAIYRIAQEALTNALRHAGAAAATVTVTFARGHLIVDVVDDGSGLTARPGAGEPGSGNGIVGMRERATGLGGRLDAGPAPGGGFQVHATLPTEAGS